MAEPCTCQQCVASEQMLDQIRRSIVQPVDAAPAPVKVPYRLVYGEDLAPGMVVGIDGRRREWASVLELRRSGGLTSAILVDDQGDQRGLLVNDFQTLPVRVDA